MLYREIIEEASRLPLHEQLRLVEELARNLRRSEERAPKSRRRRIRPFSEMRGVLRPAGDLPSDAGLREMYVDHLIEKYS